MLLSQQQDPNFISHDVVQFRPESSRDRPHNDTPAKEPTTSCIQLRDGMRYMVICLDDKTALKVVASKLGETSRESMELGSALQVVERLQAIRQNRQRTTAPLANSTSLPGNKMVAHVSNGQSGSHGAPKGTLLSLSPDIVTQTGPIIRSDRTHKISPPVTSGPTGTKASHIIDNGSAIPPQIQSQSATGSQALHAANSNIAASSSLNHFLPKSLQAHRPPPSDQEGSSPGTQISSMNDATYFDHHDLFGDPIGEDTALGNQKKPKGGSVTTNRGSKKRGCEEIFDYEAESAAIDRLLRHDVSQATDPMLNGTEQLHRNKRPRTEP